MAEIVSGHEIAKKIVSGHELGKTHDWSLLLLLCGLYLDLRNDGKQRKATAV